MPPLTNKHYTLHHKYVGELYLVLVTKSRPVLPGQDSKHSVRNKASHLVAAGSELYRYFVRLSTLNVAPQDKLLIYIP